MNPNALIRPLFSGPLDIVGDVHGEIDALETLLSRLGYNRHGEHPQGRRLVFVGDLVDRGPDSPAVIERVMALVSRGLAQCLLGNHELNLLRGARKPGNAWLLDPERAEQQPGGDFGHSRVAPLEARQAYLDFLASLPLALERSDLRVAHAAWVGGEIDKLRCATGTVKDIYQTFELATKAELEMDGLELRAQAELQRYTLALHDGSNKMDLLPALGERDERYQMGNPVRVVTSGAERRTTLPFWASGQWRMCDRVPWWRDYQDEPAVIVGHYWRRLRPVVRSSTHAASKPAMFGDVDPLGWLGPRENVFCVDYSVGERYVERKSATPEFDTRLAAVRWPEREIWAEEGRLA